MIKLGVFLVAVGLFLLLPSIVNFFDFFPLGFFTMILDYPYSLIVYYGLSLTLIGFGIMKIVRGWNNIV